MRYSAAIIMGLFLWGQLALAVVPDSVRVKPLPGTVTLTFDDGPSPIHTPDILKILKDHHIKATFFVMGTLAKQYPKLISQMVAEGHAVAIHTMTHPLLTRLPKERLAFEVIQPKKIVKDIIGVEPVCLRPPFGVKNQSVEAFIKKQGMAVIPIGFNSFDYDKPGIQKLVSWVVSHAKDGQIILLHDGYRSREQTVKALPLMIEGIRRKGLGFSAICYP